MPALDWEGRAEVEGSHLRVPYRLVHCERGLSAGDDGADNLLVEGDNLAVLKSLLPYYRGRVKCVYIDPPYNTGNEGWIYSDRVESPTMRKWLHKVVGDEASDMNRHDKWLCMMYPRLRLLREFLRMDGVIFVSIDDNEVHHLRGLMDEIFGAINFVASFVWEGVKKNDARFVSVAHDYVLCYARSASALKMGGKWRAGKEGLPPIYRKVEELKAKRKDAYAKIGEDLRAWYASLDKKNPAFQHRHYNQVDEVGVFFPGDISWHGGDGPQYDVLHPATGKPVRKPARGWMFSKEEKMLAAIREGKVFFGENENKVPNYKRYLHETSEQVLASVFYQDRRAAMQKLRQMLGDDIFDTPKDVGVLMKLIGVSTSDGDIILDSFAGSGATGHAVLQLNKEDGGKRRFVLVEMEKEICRNVAAVRLSRAAAGGETGGGKPIAALGGGFRYCKLGRELFDEYRQIARGVKFSDLAAHVFFSETGVPIPKRADGKTPFLGATADKAVYLLFNGVLGDKTPAGGNVLNPLTLRTLPTAAKGVARIVYGESCELTKARRKQANIVFRKIPREVKSE